MMVLETLKRQPRHGYALAQHIKRRLLKEELVKAEWSVSATKRRIRIYNLTPAGAKHLERQVSSFERMLEGIERVLAPEES